MVGVKHDGKEDIKQQLQTTRVYKYIYYTYIYIYQMSKWTNVCLQVDKMPRITEKLTMFVGRICWMFFVGQLFVL